jgi:pimeloyl-ACP methyl ester carboxylesterase
LSALTEIVSQIADALGLERFAVGGFSGGGPFHTGLRSPVAGPRHARRSGLVLRAGRRAGGGVREPERRGAGDAVGHSSRSGRGDGSPLGGREWFAENPLRFLEDEPEAADEAILLDPGFRSGFPASNREAARQGQAGLIGDWVAEALPWGFRLADIEVPVDLWIGERDPGRAPLDAPEIARRIPSCSIHEDADAGHWLLIRRWAEIVETALC